MAKSSDDISKSLDPANQLELNKDLAEIFRNYFQRIQREKIPTRDNDSYKVALDQAKIAGLTLQSLMLKFQMVIENFDREKNVNLKFLDSLYAQEQYAFIEHHLKIMHELYAECEKQLNEFLSYEFFEKQLRTLYPDKTSFSNREMSEAYRHISEHLKSLEPIIEAMIKALNDPANVDKLKSFEDALISPPSAEENAAKDATQLAAERANKQARKAAREKIGLYIFGIVGIILGITFFVAITGGFGAVLVAGVIGFILGLVGFAGIWALGIHLGSAVIDYRQLKRSPQSTSPNELDKEPVIKFSDKMRAYIQKIKSQFSKPDHSAIQKSPTSPKEKAFFEKSASELARDKKDEVQMEVDETLKPKRPGGGMPEY